MRIASAASTARLMLMLVTVLGLCMRAMATPPMLPGEGEFEKAVRRGAASARSEFDHQTSRLLRKVEQASSHPPKPRQVGDEYHLIELETWYEYWIDAETYQVLKEQTAPDSFERDVWHPLYRLWTRFILCADQLDARRLASGDSARDLQLAEQWAREVVIAAEIDLPYKLAVLATTANRPDLLEQVLQANGGEIREPQRPSHPQFQGRVYTSVPEFMELDNSARDQQLIDKAQSALVPRVYPDYRETWPQTLYRWRRFLTTLIVLIVGSIVIWNRRAIQILYR